MGILRRAAEGGAEGGMKGPHASRLPPPLYSKMATVDFDSSADPEMDLTSDEELEREAEGFKEQGNVYYVKKDYAEAFNFYTKAIDLCPKNASYYGNRAATLMMLSRYREALEDSQQAVRLDDTFMKGHMREGKCHLLLGNAMAASRCFQKVLELEPDNSQVQQELKNAESILEFERLAEISFEKRDFRMVVFCMDRALEPASACHRFKVLKAECLALLGRYPEAQSVASDILRIDSTNGDALYVRGLCLYYEDCIDKAVQFFIQALRMAPDHEKARLACRVSVFEYIISIQIKSFPLIFSVWCVSEHKNLLKNAQLELKKSKRKDYYKVLGVDKNATEDELKKAYRKRALMHHPDRHSGASAEVQKEEEKKFKEVGEAFTVLSDPKKKSRYDSGHDLEDDDMNMDFDANNIFKAFFGGPGGFSFEASGPGNFFFQFG
ncbi:dnaJ homolog subfamily C member 7-like [Sinocyclocheilus grahami]|uniref:dnaJ homolog subfamily C member 7-like n=1 Tax=Sinocyclocheilus grahami TaxID=75366 RepID=UPI0007AC96B6|nr:PREDICTED: dnaJ homolog subfamily C member 7-like [Sinocyclocheilus grahami]